MWSHHTFKCYGYQQYIAVLHWAEGRLETHSTAQVLTLFLVVHQSTNAVTWLVEHIHTSEKILHKAGDVCINTEFFPIFLLVDQSASCQMPLRNAGTRHALQEYDLILIFYQFCYRLRKNICCSFAYYRRKFCTFE